MRDTEFYEALLGLSAPWRVTKGKLDSPAGRVDVWIEDRSGVKWKCPECAVRINMPSMETLHFTVEPKPNRTWFIRQYMDMKMQESS